MFRNILASIIFAVAWLPMVAQAQQAVPGKANNMPDRCAAPSCASSLPPPPPTPPTSAFVERDQWPGPKIVFFDNAGKLIGGTAENEVLKHAVEDWQIGPKEAFLLCIRKRNGDAHRPVQLDITDLTQRLHQQGATTVVVNFVQPCAGPTRVKAQLQYDSVEILGVTVF